MQIYDFVEQGRSFYENRHIPLQSGEDYSQYELIRAINHAKRSRYLDDNARDAIIGDFPYDNISKYRIRLEARSTDFDVKHIEIEPVDSSDEARAAALVASKALKLHLDEIEFGRFLNQYADVRPEYGTVLTKTIDDRTYIVPWENVITDMTEILTSPIIEKHYKTPAQLRKQKGWDNVDDAIRTAAEKRKDKDMGTKGDDTAQTLGNFIEVYEVTGELPMSYLLEIKGLEWTKEDEVDYVLARVIYAPFGKDKAGNNMGVVFAADQITEEEYPYDLDVRHPQVGRAFGEGIPEELSEHQRWHNFYKTEEARAVALGGKILFVTNDGDVVDSIYAEGIDHGTIMHIGDDKMFQQASTMPNSVPMYQSIDQSWEVSADRNSSSFDAVIGEEAKSGTPFRSQYLQNVAGTSQFEREREDMGFFIKELIKKRHLKIALNKAAAKGEIDTVFNRQELDLIDRVIMNRELVSRGVESLMQGVPVTPEMQAQFGMDIQRELRQKGTRRKITDIAEFIKKAGDKVMIHTTDEQRSKMVLFESLSNALMLFGENDPARLAIRDRVLDYMGVSYDELAMYANQAAQMAEQTPTKPLQLEQQAASETLPTQVTM